MANLVMRRCTQSASPATRLQKTMTTFSLATHLRPELNDAEPGDEALHKICSLRAYALNPSMRRREFIFSSRRRAGRVGQVSNIAGIAFDPKRTLDLTGMWGGCVPIGQVQKGKVVCME